MKEYINAELTIVSIKNDIIATSGEQTIGIGNAYSGGDLLAPDRWERFDYE